MNYRTVVLNFLAFLLLLSCDDEKVNRPAFMTYDVSELSDQGVTFNGKISLLGSTAITNYGFVWATHPAPGLTDSVHRFDQNANTGLFSIRITDDLIDSTEYYVRSFVSTNQNTFYGNTIKFESLGSSTPLVTDFTPTSGGALAKITINGDHFSHSIDKNLVKIGATTLKVISASRNKLVVEIPSAYFDGDYPITVTTSGKTGTSANKFRLEGPMIESISPSSGPAGTIVTLTGKGFSIETGGNIVYFEDRRAIVTAASTDRLVVTVPADILAGPKPLSVMVNGATGISPVQFDLTGPTITSFSPAAGVQGSEVVVHGNGFSSTPENNRVQVGPYDANVVSATPQELHIIVPFVQAAGEATISVTVSAIYAAASTPFIVEGPEVTSFSPAAQYGGREITIVGKNFDTGPTIYVSFSNFAASIINQTSTTMTVLIPNDLTAPCPITIRTGGITYQTPINFTPLSPWEKQAAFAGGKRYGATSFTIGSSAYIAMGIGPTSDRKDVWQFDSSNNSWKRKADYPGPSRAFSFSFVINGKAYVGGGGHYGSSSYDHKYNYYDLWEYDPATDTWVQKAGYSSTGLSSVNMNATAIGSYGYFAANNTLYRYDPSSNQWTTFSSYPYAHSAARSVALTIGDKGYFGTGGTYQTFWEYTPSTNTWAQLPSCPGYFQYWGPVSMVVNNRIYVGMHSNFYEYDPITTEWKSVPSMPEEFRDGTAFSLNNIGYVVTGLNGIPLDLSYTFNPNY